MKCIILAFDGLEYDFVENFYLENLKQDEYGKVQIPQECFFEVKTGYDKITEAWNEPWTPLVWFSFLIGKLSTQGNLGRVKRWDNKVLNILGTLSAKIGLKETMSNQMGKMLTALGFSMRPADKRDYNVPTIFDLTEKSYAINVPVYSKDWSFALTKRPEDFNNFKDFVDSALTEEMTKFHLLKKPTLCFLEQNTDWDLFMVYFKTLRARNVQRGKNKFRSYLASLYLQLKTRSGLCHKVASSSPRTGLHYL